MSATLENSNSALQVILKKLQQARICVFKFLIIFNSKIKRWQEHLETKGFSQSPQ